MARPMCSFRATPAPMVVVSRLWRSKGEAREHFIFKLSGRSSQHRQALEQGRDERADLGTRADSMGDCEIRIAVTVPVTCGKRSRLFAASEWLR